MSSQQHKRSSPVTLNVGNTMMVRVPERNSKLSPKFVDPRLIVEKVQGNKFELFDPLLNTLEVVYNDRLKKTSAKTDLSLVDTTRMGNAIRLDTTTSSDCTTNTSHPYNLRSRN